MPAKITIETQNQKITLGSSFRLTAIATELVVGNNYRIQFIEKNIQDIKNIKDTIIETLAATPSSNKEIIVRSKEITSSTTGVKIYVVRICSGKPDSLDITSSPTMVQVYEETELTVIPPLDNNKPLKVIVKAKSGKTPTGSVQFFLKDVEIATRTLNKDGEISLTHLFSKESHKLVAKYMGDQNFLGSEESLALNF